MSMIRPTPETLRADPLVAEVKARLEAAFGERLQRVILFGSRARGEAGPDSDWDFAVVLHPPARDDHARMLDLIGALYWDLNTQVSLKPVDPDRTQWPWRIAAGVAADGLAVYGRGIDFALADSFDAA